LCNTTACGTNSQGYQVGNCGQPAFPAADDGCETVVYYNSSHCGSCATHCTAGSQNCVGLTCQACGGTGAGCLNDSACCNGGCDLYGCECCN
jgi:hypothetical protein